MSPASIMEGWLKSVNVVADAAIAELATTGWMLFSVDCLIWHAAIAQETGFDVHWSVNAVDMVLMAESPGHLDPCLLDGLIADSACLDQLECVHHLYLSRCPRPRCLAWI